MGMFNKWKIHKGDFVWLKANNHNTFYDWHSDGKKVIGIVKDHRRGYSDHYDSYWVDIVYPKSYGKDILYYKNDIVKRVNLNDLTPEQYKIICAEVL